MWPDKWICFLIPDLTICKFPPADTQVEFVAKTANSQMTTTEEEDEPAANLKRRGGYRFLNPKKHIYTIDL